jgi:sn-glycerol 3-phosphate transport system substrate-binding protein
MKLKPALALFACASLGLGAAMAQAKPVELSLFFPVSVGGPITTIVDGLCTDFNKENPDIKVSAVYCGSYADTMVKAQTGIKGGNPPDLAIIQATELYTLLDMNAVQGLDQFVVKDKEKGFIDDFYPAFMENCRAEGKLWSLPFQRSTIVLYYNKDMFKKAGLDSNRPPKNWKELADDAKKLTVKDSSGVVNTWGIEIPSTGFQYWMFQALCLQNGLQIMNDEGTEVYFDKPAAVEALQYWLDLEKVQKVMPDGIVEWATAPTDFIQGKTAMMFHTTGNLTNVRKSATFDFGVAFLPADKSYGSPTGGGNIYMFSGISNEHKAAAWRFMRYLTSAAKASEWSMKTGFVATRKSSFEAEPLKSYVVGFPQAAVARDQLKYAKAELSTHSNSQIYQIINDDLQAALAGTKTPIQALSDAQSQTDEILGRFKK